MDAKAADFDTSALTAQVASVQEPANEPVAEEVPAEQADVAETAEGAVTEEEASRYEEIKAQRQEWRDQVNALRASQETLTAKIAEANA